MESETTLVESNGQSNDAAKPGLLEKILVMPPVQLLTSTFNKRNGGLGEYCERLSYEWELANSAKLDPKKIFAHVNSNKRMGTRIQRLLHPDGSPATTDQEMADLLKQTFQDIYRKHKGSTPTFHPRTEIRVANPHITESETQRALEALNPNKEAGPNGLFPKALKTLSPYIVPTLSRIFNLSLQISLIPDDWRHAIVTPNANAPRTADPSV